MGPITLFDKSFLQSLSVDESVWFDHYFLTNVCPIFYVETLADLDKQTRAGRTAEEEVGIIAAKFPEMHGAPCMHHGSMCLANLLGHPVAMTGQVPMAGGRPVRSGDRTGIIYDRSPESEAFARWQRGEFKDLERLFAKEWREALRSLNLQEMAVIFRTLGIDGKVCKTLEDAWKMARAVVASRDKPFDRMKLAIVFLRIPEEYHRPILESWSGRNYRPLIDYAPYAAHVLTVEIFFQLALAAHLISADRSSNRLDIAYLFYLPFCMMFVSADKLHQRCGPLFLRKDQSFVWGADLKADLGRLNARYAALPDSIKEQGIIRFARNPPKEGDCLVASLWDRHLGAWRDRNDDPPPRDPSRDAELVKKLKSVTDAPTLSPSDVDFDLGNPDTLSIQRYIGKRKGSWWQLPRDLKTSDDD